MKQSSTTVQEIIKEAKRGRMFILVDNKDRENEGDLVIPASKINAKKINFMAKHGRGLICLALTQEKVKKLKLPLMSLINKSRTLLNLSLYAGIKKTTFFFARVSTTVIRFKTISFEKFIKILIICLERKKFTGIYLFQNCFCGL